MQDKVERFKERFPAWEWEHQDSRPGDYNKGYYPFVGRLNEAHYTVAMCSPWRSVFTADSNLYELKLTRYSSLTLTSRDITEECLQLAFILLVIKQVRRELAWPLPNQERARLVLRSLRHAA